MPPRLKALVFGGSGAVGAEVVRGLAAAGIPVVFTYLSRKDRAEALAREVSQRAVTLDLERAEAIRALLRDLERDGAPNVFIHCAAVSRAVPLAEIADDEWSRTLAVNAGSAFVAAQGLAPAMARDGFGRIVLVGALDRTQSIAAPVHFAASQGMLSAMTMALAKELGPRGVLVNMVALGLLDSGLSRDADPKLVSDYRTFSALRRTGTPAEAARAILWLALENAYMNGKVVPVNGGL